MKKINIGLVMLLLLFYACSKDELNENDTETCSQSYTMELSLSSNSDITDLQIEGESELKSSALTYSCTVSPGDTLIWKVKGNGLIKRLEKIILVSYDCDEVFKDGITYKEDSTICYGVISDNAYGTIKYDIEYKTQKDSIVKVDPLVQVDLPKN